MHREQEPILAFASSNVKPSWIAVSTGREIQEISMDTLFEEQQNLADNRTSYLNNRVALDIALEKNTKDTLKDNDDYQVLLDGKIKTNTSFVSNLIFASYVKKQQLLVTRNFLLFNNIFITLYFSTDYAFYS